MNLSGMYIGTMVLATILGTGYMALVKGFQKLRGRVDSFGKNRAEKRGATPSAKDLSLKDRKALKNSLLQTPNNATKALLGVALGGGALGLLVKKGVLNPYHSKKIRDTLKAKDKDGRESAAKSFFELFGGTSQEELGFIQDTKDLKEVRENFKRELVDWYQNYLGIEESLESHKYFELQDQVQDLRHKLQSTKPELATPQLSILVKGQAAPLLLRNIHLPLNSVLPQIPDGNFRTSFNKGNGVKFSSGVEKNGKIDNKKSSPFAIYEKDGTMFLAVSRSFRGTRVGAFSKQVFEIKKISTASEGFTQGDLEKPKDPNRISEGRVDLDGFTSGQDVNFSRGFGKDRLLKKTKHLGSKLERSGISQEMIGSLSKDSKNLLVDEIVTRIAHPNIKISDKNALKKSLLSALGNVRKKA